MLNTKRNEVFNANDVINSNDLRKRIVNIDSRFRSSFLNATTDFYYNFDTPYKNIIRVRVASVEIPNVAYTFSSEYYKNTYFTIGVYDYGNMYFDRKIQIQDGNYTDDELLAAIQEQLNKTILIPSGVFMKIYKDTVQQRAIIECMGTVKGEEGQVWPPPTLTWDYIKANYTTSSPKAFDLIFTVPSLEKRVYNNGLGYNLGYRAPSYHIESVSVKAEGNMDVFGDLYYFLSIDDFNTVEQQTTENTIECLAKIIRNNKTSTIFNDGSNLLSNDIIFPAPIDIKRLNVKLMTPFGKIVDLNDMNFSFSLELTEVTNTKLYEFYRNYIWLGTIPSLPQDVRGSGVALLGGRGP